MRGAACWGGTEGRYDLEGRTEVSTTILMTYPSSVKQGGGISGVILAQQAWCPAGGATCAMAVLPRTLHKADEVCHSIHPP